ncbi:MAG: ABC transporter permease [bacterium]
MNAIKTIAWREFRAYFTSPIAYVYLITFLVAVNWIFFRTFFLIGQADMRTFFEMMPWVFLFFVPAVAMGKWAEERKLGTLEILFTLPLRDSQIVAGKFAAGLMLIAAALLLTLPAAFTVSLMGNMDWGPVIGGYLGLLFLGGAYLAVGLFVSAFTDNQIIAFIGGVALSFFLLIIGTPLVVGGATGLFSQAMQYAGLGTHFLSIARGVIDSRDIVYYLSVIWFFIYLNLEILRARARV